MSAAVNSLTENPRDSINWRRHRTGCPYYRVRWFAHADPDAGEPMYQVYCMMNTPPETFEEQEKCIASRSGCWRLSEGKRSGQDTTISLASIKRRTPARA